MSNALERARADLEAGRPWMARDRLTSALAQRQDDELLDLLAEVHVAMNDLPAAGALWFVTGREDDAALRAVEAWRERHASDERQWHSIPSPVRRHVSTPDLRALHEAAARSSRGRTSPPPPLPVEQSWRERLLFEGGCFVSVAWVVVMIGIGMWTVWHWLWG